jgi:hypothetical protein
MVKKMRMRKRKEDREKTMKMLERVKAPELSKEEVETNKKELQSIISDRFYEITAEREKKRSIKRKIYYSFASVSLVVALLAVVLFGVRLFMNREAVVRIIKDNFSIEINREDVLLKGNLFKDEEGIVICGNREIVVDISNGEYKTYLPVKYEPSQEEKDRAVQIVRRSEEAKSFVIKEGEAPVDVSKSPVVLVQGFEFPNSGIKYLDIALEYTPKAYYPKGVFIPMETVKFTVDISKGKVVTTEEK